MPTDCVDAPGIEFEYERFAPRWRALEQLWYEEHHWRQHEELYLKKQFWILEIVRRDWCLALYHGLLGKHLVAIDKGVELLNHFFAQCPVPRTIVSFACQGNYIGMAKKCKHSK